jgi:hypothetical protein
MFTVALTTSDSSISTRFAYLHPVDRRMQLSPVHDADVLLPSLEDARRALDLVWDFYEDSEARYAVATITGPDGPVQSRWYGPRAETPVSNAMERAHYAALEFTR